MIQFAVSSDSTCDLYKDYIEKREIWFAPLTFTLEKNGKQEEGVDAFSCYQDYVDFYQKVRAGSFPRTSMLNYESHCEHFRRMAARVSRTFCISAFPRDSRAPFPSSNRRRRK